MPNMKAPTQSDAQITGAWVWLFPVSQCVHAAEEYWQGYGFHRWLSDVTHTPFSLPHVLIMHVIFILAMTMAAVLATVLPAFSWVVPGLATLVLFNALAHVVGWVVSTSSSSGLVSSIMLWAPLGIVGIRRAWRGLDQARFWGGVAAGAATQVPVTWVALRAGRF